MRYKNWLITGGAGFIGVNLIERILRIAPQANIRVLDNLSVGTEEDLRGVCKFRKVKSDEIKGGSVGVELMVGDIKDYGTAFAVSKGIDIVIHLAANTGVAPSVDDPRADMETNIIGTFNMLESAKQNGITKFIFASSGAPLGEVDPPIHEGKVPKPVSPYGASKLAGEGYCCAYFRTFGLKTVSLRFGNVYGPRSKHKSSVVAKFFKSALKGEPLEIYGDGNQTRDFIFIDDLVRAVLLAAASEVGGEVFQIATYKETTVNEIAEKIKDIVERRTGIIARIVYGQCRAGDVRRNYSDISKAEKMLGFKPLYDLEAGIEKTFDYFLNGTGKE
ncbi:MAG: GDP-mannose 4,6-dehydratase [Nitrospirae bacterium]|nr:GDP-mannose 4,6-dehydratase [Nitrospirota bacterium]MCL5976693.1 GDP-mannose 4,6-dehydratase [Nitrospirota bacterium]